MSSVYRKVSNIFPGGNHDQHDVMDHDHDHDRETPTGSIKIDNQAIFAREFTKRPTQIYDDMVDVLKQLKDTKRVNETLQNEFNERKNHDKKKILTKPHLHFLLLFFTNEFLNFLTLKNTEEFVKSLNRSNMPFVLNFEPITIGIPQKIWNSITLSLVWKNRPNANFI